MNKQALFKAIDLLSDRLKQKGYEDSYLSIHGTHNFKETLSRHFDECIASQNSKDNQRISSIVLSNTTQETEDNSIRCDFHLHFMQFNKAGNPKIEIEKMVIDEANFFGTVKRKELHIKDTEILTRDSVNQIMAERKRGLRL